MTGEYLKEKIKSTGFQQVEVASRLGISPQGLESKLKSKDIKVSFLLEVARALNKNIYFFLDDLDREYYVKTYPNRNADQEPVMDQRVSEVIVQKLESNEEYSKIMADAQTRTLINQDEIIEKLDKILEACVKK